jgi:hypothetical protein
MPFRSTISRYEVGQVELMEEFHKLQKAAPLRVGGCIDRVNPTTTAAIHSIVDWTRSMT